MPQNSITPEQKAQAVDLGGLMAHIEAVMQRFNSEVVAAGLAGKVDNATVTALTGRVSDIEALIGSATTPDADNIINKVREMIDFFSGITEEKTLAGLLSALKTELEAEIPTTMAWSSITGKPETYPAAAHNHDSLYVSEVSYDSATGELRRTKNGTTTKVCDVVTSGFKMEYSSSTGIKSLTPVGGAVGAFDNSTGIKAITF